VGEQLGEELGEGRYRLEAVAPGKHRFLVYDVIGDVYDEPFATDVALASAQLEVMIDLCVETQLTRVRGTVRDARGKAAKGAAVAVRDLFLDTTTDAKGHYEIELPPGTWEVTAWTDGTDEYETFVSVAVTGPEEPGEEMPLVELDLTIE
jgi:hypothetical protein